jgi:hypothetical protein
MAFKYFVCGHGLLASIALTRVVVVTGGSDLSDICAGNMCPWDEPLAVTARWHLDPRCNPLSRRAYTKGVRCSPAFLQQLRILMKFSLSTSADCDCLSTWLKRPAVCSAWPAEATVANGFVTVTQSKSSWLSQWPFSAGLYSCPSSYCRVLHEPDASNDVVSSCVALHVGT